MDKGKTGKKDRMLVILYRALAGEHISVSGLAAEYQVCEKSILRDISEIKHFFIENRELTGNAELVYNVRKKDYRLSKESHLKDKDVLVLMKILLGCRALPKNDMYVLADKLAEQASGQDKAGMLSSLYGELSFYQSVKVNDIIVKEKLWQLEECVRRGKSIVIVYRRLDGKQVCRKLYPVATVFSAYYFYLMACMAEEENSDVVFYRIDRISEMKVLDEPVPLDIEERRKKETAKMYVQNMFMGERTKIRFLYSGPSVQAVLDRFPTAKIIKQNENGVEISAMVEYSRGTIMELLSQGSWIKVLAPERLVRDLGSELASMTEIYKNIGN